MCNNDRNNTDGDSYTGLYDAGNTGYNPGYPYAPLEPSGGQGDSGYNPGAGDSSRSSGLDIQYTSCFHCLGSYAPLTPGGGGWNTGHNQLEKLEAAKAA